MHAPPVKSVLLDEMAANQCHQMRSYRSRWLRQEPAADIEPDISSRDNWGLLQDQVTVSVTRPEWPVSS
ncbi:hypothetical protein [Mycobacteroides abscessus]|uniref:hypothetical protein n=1 Tax=Mycobacteroides abscessus TaxID=36809 RepID=UPI0009A86598|nr:hypothetical protein [Mycobacteroides abscessus]